VIRELVAQLIRAWHSTSWVELVAAALAVLYLLLAIRQRIGCWAAAFVSSCLYVWVMFGARLYMESLLNAFYAAMAIYGYRQWTRGAADFAGGRLAVSRWSAARNALGLLAVVGMSLVTSFFLRRFTPAAWPFVDSMTAWASVFATFLVARKVYENWHWWLVIDSLSLWLYFNRGLYVTMLLFAMYLLLIAVGMREWRRDVRPAARVAQLA
jgi:nicotinamide mononucleotide transporter